MLGRVWREHLPRQYLPLVLGVLAAHPRSASPDAWEALL